MLICSFFARRPNIYFNFTSPTPGTFIIALHYKGREKAILEMDLNIDDLLEKVSAGPRAMTAGLSDMRWFIHSKKTTSTCWTSNMCNSTCRRCSVSSTRSSRSDKRPLPFSRISRILRSLFCFRLIHADAYEHTHAPFAPLVLPQPISTRFLDVTPYSPICTHTTSPPFHSLIYSRVV